MSEQTLEQAIKGMASLDSSPVYLWSGGEVLLTDKNLLHRAMKLQSYYHKKYAPINSIQTNGLLLNEDWISFFKQYNFQIGISWDGLNASARITKDGQATTQQAWKALERCAKSNLQFGVISVLTQENIEDISIIGEKLYSLGVKRWTCKPYVGEIDELSLSNQQYAQAMCQLLNLWLDTKKDWIIEPCCSFIQALNNDSQGLSCQLTNACHEFLTIKPNGDITCCDFVPQEFTFGNVRHMSLQEMIVENDIYQQFIRQSQELPEECQECPWQHICQGGCLHYRRLDKQRERWNKFALCRARKKIFQYYSQP